MLKAIAVVHARRSTLKIRMAPSVFIARCSPTDRSLVEKRLKSVSATRKRIYSLPVTAMGKRAVVAKQVISWTISSRDAIDAKTVQFVSGKAIGLRPLTFLISTEDVDPGYGLDLDYG